MRKRQTKLLVILIFAIGVSFFGLWISYFTASAESDEIVTQINKYKTWTKFNKKPIGVDFASLLKKAPDAGLDNGGFVIDGDGG